MENEKNKSSKNESKSNFFALSMAFVGGSIAVSGSMMSAYAKETVDTQDNQADDTKMNRGKQRKRMNHRATRKVMVTELLHVCMLEEIEGMYNQ